MPLDTRLSFHLNNTKECPYVTVLGAADGVNRGSLFYRFGFSGCAVEG